MVRCHSFFDHEICATVCAIRADFMLDPIVTLVSNAHIRHYGEAGRPALNRARRYAIVKLASGVSRGHIMWPRGQAASQDRMRDFVMLRHRGESR